MSGHGVMWAMTIAREEAYLRDRKIEQQRQIRAAMANDPAQISEVSWFGGIKATARFLSDSVQEAISQRRMTEARG